jgi:hypothetical protein
MHSMHWLKMSGYEPVLRNGSDMNLDSVMCAVSWKLARDFQERYDGSGKCWR